VNDPSRFRIVAAVCAILLSGCAAWPRSYGSRPCCITNKPIVTREPIWWHLFDVTVVTPVKQTFNLARQMRRLGGVPVKAWNMEDGEVSDSAFFTNRDPAHLSPDEVRWGPTRPDDLAQPPLVITKPKHEGKTPGFFVKDARGRTYLLKLDPLSAPELLSGAEVVTSKLLYALGYHVPSYEILRLAPDELRRDPQVPLTEAALTTIIQPRLVEGKVRVSASKFLEGDILGPASFKRFKDCAEMRALKVVYAWVNNIDTKDHNSLLVWDGQQTRGYLIDFGTSLGADAGVGGPKDACEGWVNAVDLRELSLKVGTLGIYHEVCDVQTDVFSPGVGFFSSSVDPDRWKPYAPNLAFAEMNEQDAQWIAHRMARVSNEQIMAAVSAGQYSHSEDAAYLTNALIQRRDAIVRHYREDEDDAGTHARGGQR